MSKPVIWGDAVIWGDIDSELLRLINGEMGRGEEALFWRGRAEAADAQAKRYVNLAAADTRPKAVATYLRLARMFRTEAAAYRLVAETRGSNG